MSGSASAVTRAVRGAYAQLAQATRVVMAGDLDTQYAVRQEVRREIRTQLRHGAMEEGALVREIAQTADMLLTSVVQARFNESTGSHTVQLRDELLKKDGTVTNLEFLSPEEAWQRMQPGSQTEEINAAVGCKTNTR